MTADFMCGCGLSAASPAPRCRACPQRSSAVQISQFGGQAPFATRPPSSPVAPKQTPQPLPPGSAAGSLTQVRPLPASSSLGPLQPLVRYSRWRKSAGTFGPVGRLLATFVLILPLPVFLVTVAVGVGIIGAGIYVLVVMPWALRDIWKRAPIQLDTAAARPAPHRF